MNYDIVQATLELQRIKRRLNNIRRDFGGQDIHCADLEINTSQTYVPKDAKTLFRAINEALIIVERTEHNLYYLNCHSTT